MRILPWPALSIRRPAAKRLCPFTAGLLAVAASAAVAVADDTKPSYPKTRKDEQVDTYHGTAVADPYRWLEDDRSPETAEWVKAQNAVTFGYLEKIPYRAKVRSRLEQLFNYPKYSSPTRRGEHYFFTKNDGLQNQSVHYVQKGLTGTPEVLIDPNTLSPDGTTRLAQFSLSKDGKYAVVGLSKGGSDWQDYRVMEIATKKMLPDELKWVKVSGASWAGDGFFYSRYPEPEKGRELSTKNENHQVYFHEVGTPQSSDVLVYEDPKNPQRFHGVRTTEDERFAVLTISDRGKGKDGNALFIRDLSKGEKTFRPVVAEITDSRYAVLENIGDKLLVRTDHKAPNEKVVLIDPPKPEEANWTVVLPEKT
jgi:prolyl oligopeptidase